MLEYGRGRGTVNSDHIDSVMVAWWRRAPYIQIGQTKRSWLVVQEGATDQVRVVGARATYPEFKAPKVHQAPWKWKSNPMLSSITFS